LILIKRALFFSQCTKKKSKNKYKKSIVLLTYLGLQFLVKITTDLGLPERETYENELKKVNKMKEIQLQV